MSSDLLIFDWLTNIDIFTQLPCSASFSHKKTRSYLGIIQERFIFASDTASTDCCERTSSGRYHTIFPHLCFTRLPTSQFYHHLSLVIYVHYDLPFLLRPRHVRIRSFKMLPTLNWYLISFDLKKAILFPILKCAWFHSWFTLGWRN